MTIAFLRHGQTEWNRQGRLQGQVDIPLNDVGREQARSAARGLHEWEAGWSRVVTSPLGRAHETADIIARALSLPLGPAYDALVERAYGEAEGLTIEEAVGRWPDRRYPGMETEEELGHRGLGALEEIGRAFPGEDLVVVCHGALIRCTLQVILGEPVEPIMNASGAMLEVGDDGWEVLSINGRRLTADVDE